MALTDESAGKAIDAAQFAAEGNDLALDLGSLYGTKEAGAYPLVLATYEIVCSKGYDADTAAAVKSFLTVAANEGQADLSAAGYVPLPDTFKERLLTVDRGHRVNRLGHWRDCRDQRRGWVSDRMTDKSRWDQH